MRMGWNAVRTAVLGLAVVLVSACAETPLEPGELSAQESVAAGRGLNGGDGILGLRDRLGLTEAQVTEIQRIMEDVQAANAPLRERMRPADGQRPDREAARAVREQIMENLRGAQAEIRGVLTDEQEATLRELRADRREGPRRGGRGRSRFGGPDGGRPGFGRPNDGGPGAGGLGAPMIDLPRLRERLALTEDQVARLREIRVLLAEENRSLLEQLRESGVRPRGPDAEANPLVAQIRANASEATERMKAVLTAEQTAKLDELRQQMEERRGTRDGRRFGPRRR